MRGAPITIKCDCGEMKHVPYGERWDCPTCGRRWNTNQIPAEEYWGIMKEMRRYRLQVMGFAVVVAVTFAVLAIVLGPRVMLLAPIVVAGWYLLYMPRWRQKVRRRARNLPKWQLQPE
jgi:Flp pilus assembly protein TadB